MRVTGAVHFCTLYISVEDHDTEYEYEGSDLEEEDESVKPGEPRQATGQRHLCMDWPQLAIMTVHKRADLTVL